jgi:transcriptional regulator with XRE-family HTH domain
MNGIVSPCGAGELLREWRKRRRLSQLDLACEAAVSTRHLSFVETERSLPSREMLLRLAEHLDIPLRARNLILNAAGFAGFYPERGLDAPELAAARTAVNLVLSAHLPYPALAVDRRWNLIASNTSAASLLVGVAETLLVPPINVLRLSLHPEGLASRIHNFGQWRVHLLSRLQQQIDRYADRDLISLQRELTAYPAPVNFTPPTECIGIAVPLQLRVPGRAVLLSLISTTTVFGTPTDITLCELALECFYPADGQTRSVLEQLAKGESTTFR